MEELLVLLKSIKPNVDFESGGNLVEDGALDSLDILDIIEELETKMGVEFDGNDIDPDNFSTVEKMWGLIQKRHESK